MMHQETKQWYEANAAQYTEKIDGLLHFFKAELDQFIAAVGEDAVVLDVGGAASRDAAYFRSQGLQAINLDLIEAMLQSGQQLHPEVPVAAADFMQLPIAATSVDGIWSHGSLLHLETIEEVHEAFAEFNRVLRVGGQFWFKVKAQTGEAETAIVSDSLSNHERFFRYFTLEQMTRLLEEHGFSVTFHTQYVESANRRDVEWLFVGAEKVEN